MSMLLASATASSAPPPAFATWVRAWVSQCTPYKGTTALRFCQVNAPSQTSENFINSDGSLEGDGNGVARSTCPRVHPE